MHLFLLSNLEKFTTYFLSSPENRFSILCLSNWLICLCLSYIIYSVLSYFLLAGDFIRINGMNFMKNEDTKITTNHFENIRILRNILRNTIHLYKRLCEICLMQIKWRIFFLTLKSEVRINWWFLNSFKIFWWCLLWKRKNELIVLIQILSPEEVLYLWKGAVRYYNRPIGRSLFIFFLIRMLKKRKYIKF